VQYYFRIYYIIEYLHYLPFIDNKASKTCNSDKSLLGLYTVRV